MSSSIKYRKKLSLICKSKKSCHYKDMFQKPIKILDTKPKKRTFPVHKINKMTRFSIIYNIKEREKIFALEQKLMNYVF